MAPSAMVSVFVFASTPAKLLTVIDFSPGLSLAPKQDILEAHPVWHHIANASALCAPGGSKVS